MILALEKGGLGLRIKPDSLLLTKLLKYCTQGLRGIYDGDITTEADEGQILKVFFIDKAGVGLQSEGEFKI